MEESKRRLLLHWTMSFVTNTALISHCDDQNPIKKIMNTGSSIQISLKDGLVRRDLRKLKEEEF